MPGARLRPPAVDGACPERSRRAQGDGVLGDSAPAVDFAQDDGVLSDSENVTPKSRGLGAILGRKEDSRTEGSHPG